MVNYNTQPDRNPIIVNCDQEAWIRTTIETAIDMVLSIKEKTKTGRDLELFVSAKEGIVNGAAYQIITTLPHLKPEFSNIRYPGRIRPEVNPTETNRVHHEKTDKQQTVAI